LNQHHLLIKVHYNILFSKYFIFIPITNEVKNIPAVKHPIRNRTIQNVMKLGTHANPSVNPNKATSEKHSAFFLPIL